MTILNRLVPIVLLVAVVFFVRAPFMIDGVRYESTMGLVQKIFYFHVPAAITMLRLGVRVRHRERDLPGQTPSAGRPLRASQRLSWWWYSALIVLVTGPIWARKAWGVWWQWEARLTATLIMWMIFVAYLLLRRFGGAGAEVLAAAVGLFGMALVPFVYWSVNMWRTLHPTTNVVITLPPDMLAVFGWCAIGFLLLYFVAADAARASRSVTRGAGAGGGGVRGLSRADGKGQRAKRAKGRRSGKR